MTGGQKDKAKMIVYTVGTFDLLHVDHLALLKHCKSLEDFLAFDVASDEVVNMYKHLSCVDIVRPYHALEYVSGCIDIGTNSHNLDVDAYLKEIGKEIAQVRDNPRTSSTKIKQMVMAQSQARNRPN
jgi:glycerol-3-phosphate cytidylyltransferase